MANWHVDFGSGARSDIDWAEEFKNQDDPDVPPIDRINPNEDQDPFLVIRLQCSPTCRVQHFWPGYFPRIPPAPRITPSVRKSQQSLGAVIKNCADLRIKCTNLRLSLRTSSERWCSEKQWPASLPKSGQARSWDWLLLLQYWYPWLSYVKHVLRYYEWVHSN